MVEHTDLYAVVPETKKSQTTKCLHQTIYDTWNIDDEKVSVFWFHFELFSWTTVIIG